MFVSDSHGLSAGKGHAGQGTAAQPDAEEEGHQLHSGEGQPDAGHAEEEGEEAGGEGQCPGSPGRRTPGSEAPACSVALSKAAVRS